MTRLQRVASGLFLALLLLAVPRLALEDSARAEVDHLRSQVLAQQERNAAQRAINERIREDIEALSSDARAVERVVRQELHAVRPDEHVFFFPSGADPGPVDEEVDEDVDGGGDEAPEMEPRPLSP